MPVTFQSDGGTVFANANNNNAITLPLPATRPVGSFLFAVMFAKLITASITPPSGFNLLTGFEKTSGTAGGGRIWVYYKKVVGGETAPTFSCTGATGTSGELWGGCMFCYSGIEDISNTPSIDGSAQVNDASGTTTCTYPAVTTAVAGSLVMRFLARFEDAATTFTPSAGHNEREDAASTNRTGAQFHFQDLQTSGSPGSQASVTVAPSSTAATRYLAISIAFSAQPTSDTATVSLALTPSVNEFKATEYLESATENFVLTVTGVEYSPRETTDTATVRLSLTPAGGEGWEDARTGDLRFTPSAVESADWIESGIAAVLLVVTGDDVFETISHDYIDTNTENFALVPTQTEAGVFTDEAIEGLALTPTGQEVQQFTDVGEVSLELDVPPDAGDYAGYTEDTIVVDLVAVAGAEEYAGFTEDIVPVNILVAGAAEEYAGFSEDIVPVNILVAAAAEEYAGFSEDIVPVNLLVAVGSDEYTGFTEDVLLFNFLIIIAAEETDPFQEGTNFPALVFQRGDSQTTSGQSFTSGSFTPSAGDCILFFATVRGNANTPTVTDTQNLGWSLIQKTPFNSGADACYLFASNKKAAATAETITLDLGAGQTATEFIVVSYSVQQAVHFGSGALRGSGETENDLGTLSPHAALPANAKDTSAILEYVASDGSGGISPPAGWTTDYENSFTGAGTSNASHVVGGFTGTTPTWTDHIGNSLHQGVIIAELDLEPISIVYLHLTPISVSGISVSDNFNRVDLTHLGSNWASWGTDSLQIENNKVRSKVGTSISGNRWIANTFGANQFSEATIPAAVDSGEWVGVTVRENNSQSGYLLIAFNNFPTLEMRIYRMDGGSYTQLQGNNVTFGAGDVMRLEVSGSKLTAKLNGNSVMTSPVDTTYPSGGAPGMQIFQNGATPPTLDNWRGGDLPTEILETVDTAIVRLSLTPSAVEDYVPVGGIETTDTATVNYSLTPSSTEIREISDTETVTLHLTPSAVELFIPEAGPIPAKLEIGAAYRHWRSAMIQRTYESTAWRRWRSRSD